MAILLPKITEYVVVRSFEAALFFVFEIKWLLFRRKRYSLAQFSTYAFVNPIDSPSKNKKDRMFYLPQRSSFVETSGSNF